MMSMGTHRARRGADLCLRNGSADPMKSVTHSSPTPVPALRMSNLTNSNVHTIGATMRHPMKSSLFLCAGLHVALSLALYGQSAPVSSIRTGYVGSERCKTCHAGIYARWSKTRMANILIDPKLHPEAITPDLNSGNPLITFRKEDIAFVYGSKWKQRYFQKIGDDYFPLPAQWDVVNKVWRPYNVAKGTDWWTAFYPPENSKRPTGPLCDGCHSVNYDIQTKTASEWNVGCEKCHGP